MKYLALCMTLTCALTGTALAQTEVTVTHGPVPEAAYLDLGKPGDSVGDQRIWQFDGQTTEKEIVITDWVMTTTGQGNIVAGMESRMTQAIFSFGAISKDTIVLQGIGLYPMVGSTLNSDSVLERAIVGGTGRYAGATGTVTSTHFPDNTWQHTFELN